MNMEWQNYLSSLGRNLHSELALLVLPLAWALARLLLAVGKRVENGKPVVLHILGKEFIELKGDDTLHELLERERTRHAVEYVTLQKDNLTSSEKAEKQGSSRKVLQNAHIDKVGGGINGSRSS